MVPGKLLAHIERPEGSGHRRRIFVADDLVRQLAGAGAAIVGPASTVEAALALLEDGVDLAILDINLKGTMSFALADELARRGIRFVFATGYAAAMIPAPHANQFVAANERE